MIFGGLILGGLIFGGLIFGGFIRREEPDELDVRDRLDELGKRDELDVRDRLEELDEREELEDRLEPNGDRLKRIPFNASSSWFACWSISSLFSESPTSLSW